jgi:hypothetical protein
MWVIAITTAVVTGLDLLLSLYLLINQDKGISRVLERERNVHNAQMNQLLDRVAHAEGRPWTLPPRPVDPVSEEPEQLYHHWREV